MQVRVLSRPPVNEYSVVMALETCGVVSSWCWKFIIRMGTSRTIGLIIWSMCVRLVISREIGDYGEMADTEALEASA